MLMMSGFNCSKRRKGIQHYLAEQTAIALLNNIEEVQAIVFYAKPNMCPADRYKQIMLEGAFYWKLPEDYIEQIKNYQ